MGFSGGDPNAYVKIVCRALWLVSKDSDLTDELTSIGSVELRLKHLDVTLQSKGLDLGFEVQKWRRVEKRAIDCETR